MLCILNVGTVPTLCILYVGTVPTLCILHVGTVPMLCILNVGTVPTFSHSQYSDRQLMNFAQVGHSFFFFKLLCIFFQVILQVKIRMLMSVIFNCTIQFVTKMTAIE